MRVGLNLARKLTAFSQFGQTLTEEHREAIAQRVQYDTLKRFNLDTSDLRDCIIELAEGDEYA